MKNLIFLSLFLAFSSLQCVAQTNSSERNLYAEALSACIKKEAEEFKNISNKVDFENRVVEYDFFLTRDLPTQFENIKVEYLTGGELAERYKKTKKEIPLFSIRPMTSDGNIIKLSIIQSWFSYEKRSYNYSLEGGCVVEFQYNPDDKRFALAKTEIWGI